MAQDEFKDVNLTVQIRNFDGRKRCPHCNEVPTEMEWSSEGLRIWCRNKECTGDHYHIFTPIEPEEIDLVKVTKQVIQDWNKYCKGIRKQRKAKLCQA